MKHIYFFDDEKDNWIRYEANPSWDFVSTKQQSIYKYTLRFGNDYYTLSTKSTNNSIKK